MCILMLVLESLCLPVVIGGVLILRTRPNHFYLFNTWTLLELQLVNSDFDKFNNLDLVKFNNLYLVKLQDHL